MSKYDVRGHTGHGSRAKLMQHWVDRIDGFADPRKIESFSTRPPPPPQQQRSRRKGRKKKKAGGPAWIRTRNQTVMSGRL